MKALSAQHRRIAERVLQGELATSAYLAEFNVKDRASAHACSSRLMNSPKMKAYMEELNSKIDAKIEEKTIATKLEAGKVATEILRARFSDFDIDNLSSGMLNSPAIREVRRTSGAGKKGDSPWSSTSVKLESPLAAAEYLAKLYGWYEDKGGYQDNRAVYFLVKDEETKELLEGIKERLIGEGSDRDLKGIQSNP